jgi:hypothetical protein
MVRRLPVLQSGPQPDPPLSIARAVLLVVPAVLLIWAVLLWLLRHFGAFGAAGAFLMACGVGAGVLGYRVAASQRVRFGVVAAPVTTSCVWGVAVFGRAFESWEIAVAALAALLGLAGAGFALGIFGLLRQQRATGSLRH